MVLGMPPMLNIGIPPLSAPIIPTITPVRPVITPVRPVIAPITNIIDHAVANQPGGTSNPVSVIDSAVNQQTGAQTGSGIVSGEADFMEHWQLMEFLGSKMGIYESMPHVVDKTLPMLQRGAIDSIKARDSKKKRKRARGKYRFRTHTSGMAVNAPDASSTLTAPSTPAQIERVVPGVQI